mgnify:CR=1 FL=1|jgi:hypothetical protein
MKQIILSIVLFFSLASYAEKDDWIPFYEGNKTIHLKFTDVIDNKYTVNILWTPDDGLQMPLNGPAIVQFVPIEPDNGAQSFIIEYGFFRLPGSALVKLGIMGSDFEYNRSVDLNKTYTLKYSDLIDTTLTDSPNSVYHLGSSAPFFFQDVNYDGIKELVVVETGDGQRFTDEFYFYKLDGYKYLYKHFDLINTNEADVAGGDNIDSLTEFNDNNKTIKVWRQGGACGSTQTIYRQQSDLEFHPTIYTEWESYTNGVRRICVASEFDISNGEKALKSKTESYWDSEKSKNIELGTKYY